MSTATDRDQQSFAETAMRMGGKSEEEARRLGAVDKADEQVEKLFEASVLPAGNVKSMPWVNFTPLRSSVSASLMLCSSIKSNSEPAGE